MLFANNNASEHSHRTERSVRNRPTIHGFSDVIVAGFALPVFDSRQARADESVDLAVHAIRVFGPNLNFGSLGVHVLNLHVLLAEQALTLKNHIRETLGATET